MKTTSTIKFFVKLVEKKNGDRYMPWKNSSCKIKSGKNEEEVKKGKLDDLQAILAALIWFH